MFTSVLKEHRLVWYDCCRTKTVNFSLAFSPQAAESLACSRVKNDTCWDFSPRRICGCKEITFFHPYMQISQFSSIFHYKPCFSNSQNDHGCSHYKIQTWYPAGISDNLHKLQKNSNFRPRQNYSLVYFLDGKSKRREDRQLKESII